MLTANSVCGPFSIVQFHARYLAGGFSLKQYSSISRMRLALVACGVETGDVMATDLCKTIKRYTDGLALLSRESEYTLDLLKAVNSKLNPQSKKAGTIRTTQTWIGGSSLEKAIYVPPPPLQVPHLLEKLMTLLNDDSLPSTFKAKKAYALLQNIHPFYDGNGRLSRALYSAILSHQQPDHIHHSIFRLGQHQQDYRSAISGHFDNESLDYPYWHNMDEWGQQYSEKVQKIQKKTQQLLKSKFQFCAMSTTELLLLDSLWTYPVINVNWLMQKMPFNFDTAKTAIDKLMRLKVLHKQPVKTLRGVEIVYSSEDILTAWQAMDALIFEGKETQVKEADKQILV